MFLSSFQRGTTFTTSCFGSLGDQVFPNRGPTLKKRICSKKRRSFVEVSIPTEKGQNENGRVTSPESVHLMLLREMSHDLLLWCQVMVAVLSHGRRLLCRRWIDIGYVKRPCLLAM